LIKVLLKILLVLGLGYIAVVTYDWVATVYHLPFPPNWLGDLLRADGEFSYDTARVSLLIDLQALAFLVWGTYRIVRR
jgi:hypothetical protein